MLYHNVSVAAHSMRSIDAFAAAGASALAWYLGSRWGWWPAKSGYAIVVFALSYPLGFVVIAGRLRAYHARRTEELAVELLVLCEVLLYASALACLVTEIATRGLGGVFYATAVASSMLAVLGLHMLLRVVIRGIRRRGGDQRAWLILGHNRRAAEICREIARSPHFGIRVDQVVDLRRPGTEPAEEQGERERFMAERVPGFELSTIADVDELRHLIAAHVIDEVVVTLPVRSHYVDIERILQICGEAGVSVKLRPQVFEAEGQFTEVSHVGDTPMVTHFTGPSNQTQLLAKRAIDIFGAALGLLVLSPLLLGIALAVKFGSPGPVLFRQTRVGLHGRQFSMIKFRSMVPNALALRQQMAAQNERDGTAFKVRNDARITPVGRWLRKYHLDELPQLWNVLAGDMSLVGPRPLPVAEATGNEWWQRRRLSVPPGLTCLWQLEDDPNIPFLEWMRLDMKYIDNWSVWLDLKLMLKTFSTVARGSGW